MQEMLWTYNQSGPPELIVLCYSFSVSRLAGCKREDSALSLKQAGMTVLMFFEVNVTEKVKTVAWWRWYISQNRWKPWQQTH